jgi:pSer/pThr/pTyr-binding forkhead associated (FHA) protein
MVEELDNIINRRRTDITMAKRKRTKGQTTAYKKYTNKTKDQVTRTPLKTE